MEVQNSLSRPILAVSVVRRRLWR